MGKIREDVRTLPISFALALAALIAACGVDGSRAQVPLSKLSPSPRTVRVCGFWVLGTFVPPGAVGVCEGERLPVLSVRWTLYQTYRYYVELAHAQRFGMITQRIPTPVKHSVPVDYYRYVFDILANSHDYQFELYPAGAGTRITVRTSTHYASFGTGPIKGPKSITPPPPIRVPFSAPFSRFITAQNALTSAQRAILAIAPKGYSASPYWVGLTESSSSYAWDVRTADGPLYPRASLVYFATVDAQSGKILSVRAEHNAPGLPIPPNPTQPPAATFPTPCPQGIQNPGPARTPPPNAIPGQNYNRPRLTAKIVLPANADAPISAFSQAFASSLSLPANYGYKNAYIAEVKLLPYGVAQRQLRTGVIAFDIDNARMYVVQTIVVPHPLYSEESVPPGARVCERAYAVIHITTDAATGRPSFGDFTGPCIAKDSTPQLNRGPVLNAPNSGPVMQTPHPATTRLSVFR